MEAFSYAGYVNIWTYTPFVACRPAAGAFFPAQNTISGKYKLFAACRPAAGVFFSAKKAFLDFLKLPKPTGRLDKGVFTSIHGKLPVVSPKDKVTKGNKIETAIYIYIYIHPIPG